MQHLAALLPALSHLGAQTVPTGGGGTAVPPNVVSGLNTLIDWTKYIGYGVTILGVIGAGAAMAVAHHRGTVGEHAGKLITAIGAAIAIGAAVGIVGALAK